MRKPKVLILTTNYGNGHLQVARALEEHFLRNNRANVAVRDIYQETNPRIHEWTKKLYLKSYTKSGRQLYRLFYYGSQGITKRKPLKIFSYGYSKLMKIIKEEQPDAIINTFPSLAVQHFLMKTNRVIPTYNTVTDYCLHQSWIHPAIDKYYVATQQLKSQLIAHNINQKNIVVTGIPVQSQYNRSFCRQLLERKYQLELDRKTILIVAGAYGVSKEIKHICEGLQNDKALQILIVCGKNNQLYEELQLRFLQETHVRVFGYVNQMAELFELADCVITKPGGIILSEAVVKNVPIVLMGATPGQERENAEFFQSSRAAISYETWEQLVEETHKLIHNEAKLSEMKEALTRLLQPQAAESIVHDVLQTYYWHHSQSMVKG
ncbi:MGDG synthase family glycosyltransferase [Niallia endozanthoxylica]|uniref:Glycosyltransferase n=1 Tax=Niallia endozanthoxylica TaxID=2036016 RepID=A0A5J5HQG8_9BACI|nr:glycosyltransferase [Niallia endozanthoxylica]KAA9023982.1 glycosyltransferase [Niallia endozanthoxylica]